MFSKVQKNQKHAYIGILYVRRLNNAYQYRGLSVVHDGFDAYSQSSGQHRPPSTIGPRTAQNTEQVALNVKEWPQH